MGFVTQTLRGIETYDLLLLDIHKQKIKNMEYTILNEPAGIVFIGMLANQSIKDKKIIKDLKRAGIKIRQNDVKTKTIEVCIGQIFIDYENIH